MYGDSPRNDCVGCLGALFDLSLCAHMRLCCKRRMRYLHRLDDRRSLEDGENLHSCSVIEIHHAYADRQIWANEHRCEHWYLVVLNSKSAKELLRTYTIGRSVSEDCHPYFGSVVEGDGFAKIVV